MKSWIGFALLAMVFAGFTSVIAKLGLVGISAQLGLAVLLLEEQITMRMLTGGFIVARTINHRQVIGQVVVKLSASRRVCFAGKAAPDAGAILRQG